MVFYMGPLSTATCTARIWCLVGGYTITIVPVVFKNLRMHVVLTTKTRLDGVFLTRVTRGLIAGVISLQIGLLGYMTGAKTVWIEEVEMPPYEFNVCEFRGNTASHIITGSTVFVHLGLLVIYEAAYEDIIERGVLKRGVKSGTSGTKSTVSGHGDFGVSSAINSTVRMGGAGGLSPVAKGMKGVKSIAKQFGGGKKQAGHHHRPINCVPISEQAGIQVFKAKTGKTQMAWGTWNHGVVYLNSLHKHLWMSITTIEASYAFRIDSGLKITNNSPSSTTQFQVVIHSPVNGVKIVFEFDSAKTAIEFMSEFQTRFASLEKTID
ncbi:hypothetical protein HDU79_000128 [Rhizoclosmatium sp. JEL0117]|nr:hypothetical protein HDU79_000128 [Rhizoclosmatium sp. JEL0117]